jgi:hypothetical protein
MDHHAELSAAFEEVTSFFDALDSDGDGALSASDIARLLNQLRDVPPTLGGGDANSASMVQLAQHQEQCARCMGALDRDGDGFVSREEFTDTIMRWLQMQEATAQKYAPHSQDITPIDNYIIISSGSTQLPSSPVAVSRRRTQAEIAAYFKQFALVPDALALRRRILGRPNRGSVTMYSIRHGFPVLDDPARALALDSAWAVLAGGRARLLAGLYAFDWGAVGAAADQAGCLLHLVEAFPDPVDR